MSTALSSIAGGATTSNKVGVDGTQYQESGVAPGCTEARRPQQVSSSSVHTPLQVQATAVNPADTVPTTTNLDSALVLAPNTTTTDSNTGVISAPIRAPPPPPPQVQSLVIFCVDVCNVTLSSSDEWEDEGEESVCGGVCSPAGEQQQQQGGCCIRRDAGGAAPPTTYRHKMATPSRSKKIRFSQVEGDELNEDADSVLDGPHDNYESVSSKKFRRKKKRYHRVRVASWKYWTPSWAYQFHISLWIVIALMLLFLSNVLLLVCFVTNGWAVLHVEPSNSTFGADQPMDWHFGLWQCCRSDGFCLGPRWPAFYSVTRAFMVMALFAHALTFAWMVGHSLEKLLDYDLCTMSSLISLCYAAGLFVLIAVITFGVKWPLDFRYDFSGSKTHLSYSYVLAVCTVPLTLAAASFATVDLVLGRRNFQLKNMFVEAKEFGLDDDRSDTSDFI